MRVEGWVLGARYWWSEAVLVVWSLGFLGVGFWVGVAQRGPGCTHVAHEDRGGAVRATRAQHGAQVGERGEVLRDRVDYYQPTAQLLGPGRSKAVEIGGFWAGTRGRQPLASGWISGAVGSRVGCY